MGYDTTLRPHNIADPGAPCAWAPGDGEIVGTIEHSDVSNLVGLVLIGGIPAGARYNGDASSIQVITAFNSGGGDDALTVGIATNYSLIITDGHPLNADSATGAELIDWKPTSEQLIYARFTHTGTAPSTGKAIVTIRFKRPL